jgi:ABC-2 type transport system permease protein
MNSAQYARTFAALVKRDVTFIIHELPTRLIDGAIIAAMQTLVIGYFLPVLGMPADLVGPLFIGMITQIVFSASYNIAFRHANDLQHNKFINYQMALPLPKIWLFAQIVLAFMIEIMMITLPVIVFGSFILSSSFTINPPSWLLLILMYILSVLLYSILFLYLVFSSSYTWFLDNLWARRLTPLFFFGCGYYTWKKLFLFNETIAYITLLNPITYIHEGLRGALFGQENYLPLAVCIAMVISACAGISYLLARAVKKRLDPI